jgi:hypothetical protein
MSWTYAIRERALCWNDAPIYNGGYTGNGVGLNNPAEESVQGVGPLPEGRYHIAGLAADNDTGPFSLLLQPEAGTVMHGRAGFRIHGDNSRGNFSASHGCIVLPPQVRHQMWDSGDRELEVLP